MSYFIRETERESRSDTGYIEFQKGAFADTFWHEDSLLINEEEFRDLHMAGLFRRAFEDYDYYGITEVTIEDWNRLCELVGDCNEELRLAFNELRIWAEECFEEYEVFNILGL